MPGVNGGERAALPSSRPLVSPRSRWNSRPRSTFARPRESRKIRVNRSNRETPRMPDRIRLDGRVAVVTGAAGVIGTATLRLLADRGARLVAVDRREQDLQTAIKDLPASAKALAISADVTD